MLSLIPCTPIYLPSSIREMSTTTSDPSTNLGTKLMGDLVAAASASFFVAPMVSAVDKALVENASGKERLVTSFFKSLGECIKHPIQYVKAPQFRWIWFVYGSTYAAANVVDTVCAANKKDSGFAKWISTSVINTYASILKDRAFARLFGASSAPKATPMGSYAAWVGRDLLSMAFFFTLPPIVGQKIADYTGDPKKGYYAAQFALPLMLQFVTTPVHLLGFDIYNNPTGRTVKDRVDFMKKDYFKNVGLRMVRMVAPWSVGTIGNRELRTYIHQKFAEGKLGKQ